MANVSPTKIQSSCHLSLNQNLQVVGLFLAYLGQTVRSGLVVMRPMPTLENIPKHTHRDSFVLAFWLAKRIGLDLFCLPCLLFYPKLGKTGRSRPRMDRGSEWISAWVCPPASVPYRISRARAWSRDGRFVVFLGPPVERLE